MVSVRYKKIDDYLDIRFLGGVKQGEVISMIKSIRKAEEYPVDLKMLIDASNGSLEIKPNELYKIFVENTKMVKEYKTLKVALVMKRPIDTAISLIYTKLIKIENYSFQVFSTRNAGEEWLKGESKEKEYQTSETGQWPTSRS